MDCIIFATGFEVGTAYTRRTGFEVYGRGDRKLTDHWSSGLRTLHGFYSHGFPILPPWPYPEHLYPELPAPAE